jgi:hypothetical protein
MKQAGFSYSVSAEVLFTPEEVKNMMKCSSEHYDHLCKEAGVVGGCVYGLNNRFVVFPDEDGEENRVPALLTHSEVDLLCKILEGHSADQHLYWNMKRLMVSLNKESIRLNRPELFEKEYGDEG